MYKNKTYLAIIPARGGSKRLPRKNVMNLEGKPLIAWTIIAGLKSKYIDKVIVSSDDTEILKIAEKYGSNILKRPSEFASDTATSFDAVFHALTNIEICNYTVLLQPTSPLRTSIHIDKAIELLEIKKADAIISVAKEDHSPLWSNTLPADYNMKNFLCDEVKNKRSQDLDSYYRLNGAVYICKTKKLLEERSFILKDKVYAYIMDRKCSIDIDEELDFKFAGLCM